MSANPPTSAATPDPMTRVDKTQTPADLAGDAIPPLVAEGRKAFRRDLPDLLKRCPGQWVAYSGSRRLGVGGTKTWLYQDCLIRGLKRGEFIVLAVEPEYDDEVDLPLDV